MDNFTPYSTLVGGAIKIIRRSTPYRAAIPVSAGGLLLGPLSSRLVADKAANIRMDTATFDNGFYSF